MMAKLQSGKQIHFRRESKQKYKNYHLNDKRYHKFENNEKR